MSDSFLVGGAIFIGDHGGLSSEQRPSAFLEHGKLAAYFLALIVQFCRLTMPCIKLRTQSGESLTEGVIRFLRFELRLPHFIHTYFLSFDDITRLGQFLLSAVP